MKYSGALVGFLTAYIVALVATAYLTGFNRNVDLLSVALVILWVFVVQCALLFAVRGSVGRFILWLATFEIIFFWLPFIGYLVTPAQFPSLRELSRGVQTTNVALVYLLGGTVAIIFGYVVGAVTGQPFHRHFTHKRAARPRGPREVFLRPRWFFVCSMLFLALDAYSMLRFGVYFVGDAAAGEGTWWRRFLAFSLFNLVGTVYLMDRWRELRWRSRLFIGLPVVLSYALKILGGSRSAIFYGGLFVLQYFLVKQGDFKVRARFAMGLVAAALVAILLFPFASEARYFWSRSFTSGFETEDAKAALAEGLSAWREPSTYVAPLARLDLLEVALLIVDGPADPRIDTTPYLGVVHDAKSLVNVILPGEPFPGVLESSLTVNVIYLGISPDYFKDFNRVTTTWTMWGLAYAWAGFAGGLILLFVWAAACTFLYRFAVAWSTGPFSIYLAVWLFMKLTDQVQTFGFDMSMAYVVYDLMAFTPAACLLWFGTRLGPGASSRPSASVPQGPDRLLE